MNIKGNETGSGIRLKLEEIKSREILLKGNITKNKK
jgi:hypothetical protein